MERRNAFFTALPARHQSTVVPSQHSSFPESSGPAFAMTCSRHRTAVSAVNSIFAGTVAGEESVSLGEGSGRGRAGPMRRNAHRFG